MKRILPFAVAALFLAGCPRTEKKATLTFAVGGAPAELAVWEEIIGDFQTRTGRRVELLRQPTASDQRRQGLVIPLEARQPDPDVFLMDVVWLPQFAASGWLAPLDWRLRESALEPEIFFPRIVDLVDRWQGELVALPVYIDGGLLYYRRDLLADYGYQRPPTTWQELVAQGQRVQEGEVTDHPRFTGFVWQGAQYEGLVCNFLEFAVSHGGGITIEAGQVRLNTAENRQALQLMQNLIHRWRLSPSNTYTEMQEEETREMFQQGLALFERNWPYAWALHQEPNSPVAGQVGIAPLPHAPGESPASALGGWHIGISRFTDVPDSAWELVNYLISYAIQRRLALELGWNPGRRDLYTDRELLGKYPHFSELRQIFEHAVPRPVLPYYSQVSAVLQRHLNAALAGGVTPGQALTAAEAEILEIVAHYTE